MPSVAPPKLRHPNRLSRSREVEDSDGGFSIYPIKIVTEGFAVRRGEVYHAIESPRGEMAITRERLHRQAPAVTFRSPSYPTVRFTSMWVRRPVERDVVAAIASID